MALIDTMLEQRAPAHVAALVARLQAGDPAAARLVGLPTARFTGVPIGAGRRGDARLCRATGRARRARRRLQRRLAAAGRVHPLIVAAAAAAAARPAPRHRARRERVPAWNEPARSRFSDPKRSPGSDGDVSEARPLAAAPRPTGAAPSSRGFARSLRDNAIGIFPAAGLRAGRRLPQIFRPPPDHRQPAGRDPAHPGREPRELPAHRRRIRILRPLLGRGLLLSRGEDWRHQRRTLAPAFAPRTMPILARPRCPRRRRRGRLAQGLRRAASTSWRRCSFWRWRSPAPRCSRSRWRATARIARADQGLRRPSRPAEPPRLSAAAVAPEPARSCAAALSPPLAQADPADHRRAPRPGFGSARRATCST